MMSSNPAMLRQFDALAAALSPEALRHRFAEPVMTARHVMRTPSIHPFSIRRVHRCWAVAVGRFAQSLGDLRSAPDAPGAIALIDRHWRTGPTSGYEGALTAIAHGGPSALEATLDVLAHGFIQDQHRNYMEHKLTQFVRRMPVRTQHQFTVWLVQNNRATLAPIVTNHPIGMLRCELPALLTLILDADERQIAPITVTDRFF